MFTKCHRRVSGCCGRISSAHVDTSARVVRFSDNKKIANVVRSFGFEETVRQFRR